MSELKRAIAAETQHLHRFARALTQDEAAADDLVQDTLERAIRKRRIWRRQGSLRSWLFRILYRLHLDERRGPWRRLAARSDPVEESTLTQPGRQIPSLECRDIEEALNQLPREQRDAILLIALGGHSYEDAAAILGIPVGTLRSRLSRGRHSLQDLWQGEAARPMLRQVK